MENFFSGFFLLSLSDLESTLPAQDRGAGAG